MKALRFRRSVARYALLKLLGRVWRGAYASSLPPVSLRDLPAPQPPTPSWVRITPILAGVCGSDLATLCAKGSPYLAPITSMPFVLGHEVVGRVAEIGANVRRAAVGDRVVLRPALGCAVRGIDPPCDACRDGTDALCRNVTRGDISSGIQTGYCRDTGGAFAESLVAHDAQLYAVPDAVDDRAAVLIEPFACAIHAALRISPAPDDTILVIGCGAIGLLTIAALRATGCRARIVAAARHDHQRQHALGLGADELLDAGGDVARRYRSWAEALGAEVLPPVLGKPTVIGGADVVFDCVASSSSIDDGLRFTRGGGTLVLVGMPGVPRGVDFTPLWYKELTVRAAYAYGPDPWADGERDSFDIAIELMGTWGSTLAGLVGPPHRLEDYRRAFASALNTGRSRVVKTVFAPGDGKD